MIDDETGDVYPSVDYSGEVTMEITVTPGFIRLAIVVSSSFNRLLPLMGGYE